MKRPPSNDDPADQVGVAIEPDPADETAPPPAVLGFAADIVGLFRADVDRASMLFAFDLHRFEDVRDNAAAILARLRSGSMPCDAPWPSERVALFQRWIDDGKLPLIRRCAGWSRATTRVTSTCGCLSDQPASRSRGTSCSYTWSSSPNSWALRLGSRLSAPAHGPPRRALGVRGHMQELAGSQSPRCPPSGAGRGIRPVHVLCSADLDEVLAAAHLHRLHLPGHLDPDRLVRVRVLPVQEGRFGVFVGVRGDLAAPKSPSCAPVDFVVST